MIYEFGIPLTYFDFTVEKEIGLGIELADVVFLTYHQGYKPNEKLVQILKKTHNSQGTISFEALDIGYKNIGETIILYNDGDDNEFVLLEEDDPAVGHLL